MTTVSVELPESVFSALRQAPQEFVKEMRLAAAVKWYEMGKLSQGKAVEVAGLTRWKFINALARFQVSPFQYTAAESVAEAEKLSQTLSSTDRAEWLRAFNTWMDSHDAALPPLSEEAVSRES